MYIYCLYPSFLLIKFTYQKLQREKQFALEYGFFGRISFLRVRFIFTLFYNLQLIKINQKKF